MDVEMAIKDELFGNSLVKEVTSICENLVDHIASFINVLDRLMYVIAGFVLRFVFTFD